MMTPWKCVVAVSAGIPLALFFPSGGAAAPAAPAPGGRITVAAAAEPVVDLLPELAAAGEPKLAAHRELGERRVHVHVRELPPANVRRALAAAVGGVWMRTGGSPTLRLEPDADTTHEIAAILKARKQRFFAGLQSLHRNLALDAAGLERLRKSDPAAAQYLSEPGNRAAIQLLGLLGKERWTALEQSQRLALPVAQLGPEAPGVIRSYVALLNETYRKVQQQLPPGEKIDAPQLNADAAVRGSLEFRVQPGLNGAPFGHLEIGLGDGTTSQAMVVTGSKAQDEPNPRWIDRRGSPGDSIPDPKAPLRLSRIPRSWEEALRLVSTEGGLNLVSEEITRRLTIPPNLGSPPAGSQAEVLDQLCQWFGYQWRYEGGIYRFRSVAWYVERATEPPGTLVKAVERARREQRNLELPWLAAAAGVEPARLEKLWLHAPTAMPVVARSQGLLRFFGMLPAAQRRALAEEAGLPAQQLSPEHRQLLVAILRTLAPAWPAETAARATLRLEETPAAARWVFSSDAGLVESTVTLPSPARSPFGGGPFGGGGFGPPPGGFPMPPPGGFTPPKN